MTGACDKGRSAADNSTRGVWRSLQALARVAGDQAARGPDPSGKGAAAEAVGGKKAA